MQFSSSENQAPVFANKGSIIESANTWFPLLGDHVSRSECLIWGTHLVAGLGSHWARVRGKEPLTANAPRIYPKAYANRPCLAQARYLGGKAIVELAAGPAFLRLQVSKTTSVRSTYPGLLLRRGLS